MRSHKQVNIHVYTFTFILKMFTKINLMMLEGHRNMQHTYNNIEGAVVLDGCLTLYLLIIGFVL